MRRIKTTICTFDARTLALEACIEDLMMQARKTKYDVIGVIETRMHRLLHAVFEIGEELFLGACDSRGVGGAVRGESYEVWERSLNTSMKWSHFASLASKWEDSVIDNIDEEYNRLIEHLHDSGRKTESLQETKRRLSSKTLELIHERGVARASGNHRQASELAKLCREAKKENLKERRAAVTKEATEAEKNIRKARRRFANCKPKMTSLRRPDGTVTASRSERQWRRSSTISTPITSIATSTCLPTIFGRTNISLLRFSLSNYEMPSRR
ncbi:unnamed protein product [Haemonchus placei]|uniref:IMD domain-containing protein n=1 Tax=Haemonchus placei TaxID=6290 RepID=A0A0N4WKN1_HAEPC|nr:unnamed protein product [Haemonchus placei]